LEWKLDVAVIVERLNVVLPTRKSGRSVRRPQAHCYSTAVNIQKELYNIDFDKVVSTEEELMDMLPRASPLVLAKQLRMRLEMCVRQIKTQNQRRLAVQDGSKDGLGTVARDALKR
jgi:hypothetical protein